jgi:hypothetical protein
MPLLLLAQVMAVPIWPPHDTSDESAVQVLLTWLLLLLLLPGWFNYRC